MRLNNATPWTAGYTVGLRPDGRELLVVVVKGTFEMPETEHVAARTAPRQEPLASADVVGGEPGFSAPLRECDFAPFKPRGEILLQGTAYAPRGGPTERVTVACRVGQWEKSFDVVGPRFWRVCGAEIRASDPEPFRSAPIDYGHAFGGVDRSSPDASRHVVYERNPVGCGFSESSESRTIDGQPLPSTEETGRPVAVPRDDYAPMSFGPIGRNWLPRRTFAGTFDRQWLDDTYPFLPGDFDSRYYQMAPLDQQTEYFRGGELVELVNLTRDGRRRFRLPAGEMPISFVLRSGEVREVAAAADTLFLEPDQERLWLTWRASLPLRRNIFEVDAIDVGPARHS